MMNLKIIRIRKGIKQKDLAAKCRIRQATLSDIERGIVSNPRIRTLRTIAKELGVSLESILDSVSSI